MSRSPGAVSLVLLAVVLAGCVGAVDLGRLDGADRDGWDGDPDNPWRERTLTVAVETPPGSTREFAPQVEAALAYWEDSAARYAGYPISYRLAPDAAEPDLVVEFKDSVEDCGDGVHAAGCAPVLTRPEQIDRPERVRVRTGLSDASTVAVLKHELGHTLGLDHGDEPREVMRARGDLTTTPQPDAAERPVPWADPELSVYVDDGPVPADRRDAVREQVAHALDYYDRGADGYVTENVSFVRTGDRADADVVVAFEPGGCGGSNASCARLHWTDPDGDGAPERYTRLDVTVDAGLDSDAVAWHVARWLGRGFSFDENGYPPPLRRDASYEERRSAWWR